MNKPTNVMNTK